MLESLLTTWINSDAAYPDNGEYPGFTRLPTGEVINSSATDAISEATREFFALYRHDLALAFFGLKNEDVLLNEEVGRAYRYLFSTVFLSALKQYPHKSREEEERMSLLLQAHEIRWGRMVEPVAGWTQRRLSLAGRELAPLVLEFGNRPYSEISSKSDFYTDQIRVIANSGRV